MQAGFSSDQVDVAGHFSHYSRISDEADKKEAVFHFRPDCGSQVFYTEPTEPDLIVVSVGHAPEVWEQVGPLYEAGEYAEAADRGRELLEANPQNGRLLYNVACCESLAGRTDDALEHLGRAIQTSDTVRALARDDSDFDPIRDERRFQELVG
jgi:tetratricopeptide (TPR) repeat protein